MKTLHCALSFGYFAVVLGVTMLVLHPAYLAVSLLASALTLWSLSDFAAMRAHLRWVLPLMLVTVLLNAAFQHRGVTTLFYLHNGNAVTLESVVFGLCAAAMLASAVLWCGCFSAVLTSDKLLALTGGLLPGVSLLLSMALRLAPRVLRQLRRTYEALTAMDASRGMLPTLRRCVRAISATVSWMLEHAVVTADSMKSRGYGAARRTQFHRERWTGRDTAFGVSAALLAALTLYGIFSGSGTEVFYPALDFAPATAKHLAAWCCWAALGALPALLEGREALQWRRSRLTI